MEWLVALVLSWTDQLDELEPVIALSVLDHRRAEAYAAGDPALLAGVYLDGSLGRRTDAKTIRLYRHRGARVIGAELRVLSWRTIDTSDGSITMRIVDQLGPAHVEWDDGRQTDLPQDEPTQRVLTLVMTNQGWRIG